MIRCMGMHDSPIHVMKLGGSLLDLPDLAQRFARFVESWRSPVVVIVGGGQTADVGRRYDAVHKLDEETSHWLALRAMQVNTHLAAAILQRTQIVSDTVGCQAAWGADHMALVDPLLWLQAEHKSGIVVPHCWSFTSDSIAAHIAHQLGAAYLTLLKSTVPNAPCAVACAARLGVVDEALTQTSRGLEQIELVDLRANPPRRCVLQLPERARGHGLD